MASLEGSKTESNLESAFACESQAVVRYLYFARKADIDGNSEVATALRTVAERKIGRAYGHLDYHMEVGDLVTHETLGDAEAILELAIENGRSKYSDIYPSMARTARDEGFDEIADWFETLAKAMKSQSNPLRKAGSERRGR